MNDEATILKYCMELGVNYKTHYNSEGFIIVRLDTLNHNRSRMFSLRELETLPNKAYAEIILSLIKEIVVKEKGESQ